MLICHLFHIFFAGMMVSTMSTGGFLLESTTKQINEDCLVKEDGVFLETNCILTCQRKQMQSVFQKDICYCVGDIYKLLKWETSYESSGDEWKPMKN